MAVAAHTRTEDDAVRTYLGALEQGPPGLDLEAAFIGAVGGYAQRHGIGYAAWREIGVPTAVLHKAGIHPA